MTALALYNEIDDFAADWLENLIRAGHIAPGKVDRRSITELTPDDLLPYKQVHFFAGIGGWSYALRRAGWPDDRPVWTGSCPCQPFSAAGKGAAFADERHLWPAWFSLIAKCKPARIFGEQVEAAIGWGWLDAVFSDLEGEGYACGSAVLPACSVGSPHIRQRLWFVADNLANPDSTRCGAGCTGEAGARTGSSRFEPTGLCAPSLLGNPDNQRPQGRSEHRNGADELPARPTSVAGELGDITFNGIRSLNGQSEQSARQQEPPRRSGISNFWHDAEFIPCTDGKARPVKSSFQSVVDGLPASLGLVRPDVIAKIEKEVMIDAATSNSDYREAMHYLWCANGQKAVRRALGGPRGIQQETVLFSFLCQLATQGWAFAESIPQSCAQTAQDVLRGVWHHDEVACPSCERRLARQQRGEHSNLVRLLSSVLARYAQAAWQEAISANARHYHPLATGIPARVGKLRAAGNAIVPQVGAEFIAAAEEAIRAGERVSKEW